MERIKGRQTAMKKILVANRGEIAIRIFRACTELGIETVGIYAQEEKGAVHRFKADEAYLIGQGKKPVEAYLDIEGIIAIAKKSGADAIHPGYGFLSENYNFAKRCKEEGIKFIGPQLENLDTFGDKIKAKEAARKAGLPSIPSTDGAVSGVEEVKAFGEKVGYPILIKAALGGGGRGMRLVRSAEEVEAGFNMATSEAKKAFGSGLVYVEKYLVNPKHIEVQILGDEHGNVIHLWERDCSVQRRNQKVVEVAPCVSLDEETREDMCEAARRFMASVNYQNAGTVEFLYDGKDYYFIEVNPRVQVEHTITELITDVDIVQSQILIAMGKDLYKDLGFVKDQPVSRRGFAIQCRITTEDPENHFMPDTGRINTYRSPGGMGVRLDAGDGFQNTVVTPYFDSLLAKLCTYGPSFEATTTKMQRALKEYRIRGVKTNIPFLRRVVGHPLFINGEATTTFIDQTPELFKFSAVRNRGNKVLQYIGDTTVNGFPGIGKVERRSVETAYLSPTYNPPKEPVVFPKHILDEQGPDAVAKWAMDQKQLLLTDTSFRDAHQSLLATRVRSRDMILLADKMEEAIPQLFSMEVWGGATFDTAYRFLNESPWDRLREFRKRMPNTLLQMLLRGSNAVGYSVYPDNVLRAFILKSAELGVDVFRIFDSLNWFDQIEKSIEYVNEAGKIAEGAVCYTADLFDESRPKYSLQYYVDLALKLEKAGAHIIAIKDMAGLLKPNASYALISELKEKLKVPVHLHTHDTANMGVANSIAAARAGVDIMDVALDAVSSTTSHPAIGSVYYALSGDDRQPNLDMENVEKVNDYWTGVRKYYYAFDNGSMQPLTNIYTHEMPGGQYTNLQQQAKSVGLSSRWDDVKKMYHRVNMLFGDIVKVTPSSKVVGDMTLFMLQNDITPENFFEKGKTIDFPASVIEFFQGKLGQPVGGFPEDVRDIVLKGRPYSTVRPGSLEEPVDFDAVKKMLEEKLPDREITDEDVLGYLMYPKVFMDYCKINAKYGDISNVDTLTFFYGLEEGRSIEVEIEPGKILYIRLLQISDVDFEGNRQLFFEFNGQSRTIEIRDLSIKEVKEKRAKAEAGNSKQIGATMPGSVVKLIHKAGDSVKAGEAVLITEAMKMETSIQAPASGTIKAIMVKEGDSIELGDLLVEFE